MSIELKNYSNEVKRKLQKAVSDGLDEIGVVAVAEVQSNTPVKRGILKRSYTFKAKPNITNPSVTIGTTVPYAKLVEFKPISKGGRPHFRKTLKKNKTVFYQIMKKHLNKI